MLNQRFLLGISAAICLLVGVYLILVEQAEQVSGVLIKVGLMMAVVCLALPNLKSLDKRSTLILIVILFVLMVLAAARPKVFVIGCVLTAAVLAVNWLWKRMAGRN